MHFLMQRSCSGSILSYSKQIKQKTKKTQPTLNLGRLWFLEASFKAAGTPPTAGEESGLQATAACFLPGRLDGLMRYYLQNVPSYSQEWPRDECIWGVWLLFTTIMKPFKVLFHFDKI